MNTEQAYQEGRRATGELIDSIYTTASGVAEKLLDTTGAIVYGTKDAVTGALASTIQTTVGTVQAAEGAIANTVESVGNSKIVQSAKEVATNSVNRALEGAHEAFEKGSQTADVVAEKAKTTYNAALDAVNYGLEKSKEATQIATGAALAAKDKASETVHNFNLEGRVSETKDRALKTASDTMDYTVEKSREALQVATGAAVMAKDKTLETAHALQEKAIDATDRSIKATAETISYGAEKSREAAQIATGAAMMAKDKVGEYYEAGKEAAGAYVDAGKEKVAGAAEQVRKRGLESVATAKGVKDELQDRAKVAKTTDSEFTEARAPAQTAAPQHDAKVVQGKSFADAVKEGSSGMSAQ